MRSKVATAMLRLGTLVDVYKLHIVILCLSIIGAVGLFGVIMSLFLPAETGLHFTEALAAIVLVLMLLSACF